MSGIETSEAPEWLSKLESQREKLSKGRLGHDSGAGAACNTCGTKCPGLDLHFWRKICRACHCSKDSHDVQDEDQPGWAQFELLGKSKPNKSSAILMKIQGLADIPVQLDWVPPNTSPDMVSDYMSCLGEKNAPIVGSEGATKRREQLRRQVPLHDIRSELCCHALTPQEKSCHQEYISRIKSHVVGMGNIVRIGTLKKGDVLSIGLESSQTVAGTKCHSLPLKVSSLNDDLKYNNVPKNTTDKLLVLDSMGNVIKCNYGDYKASPILSTVTKDKLNALQIESDRIKSAVEHGPVYDKLFKDLRQLNVPVDRDVYLKPIKYFRLEYNTDPKFKDETTKFAESLGAEIVAPFSHILNNNNRYVPQYSHPNKGTIFGPNGEIWNWCQNNLDFETPYDDISVSNVSDDAPPTPNYSTHPGLHKDSNKTESQNPKIMNDPHLKGNVDPIVENLGELSLKKSEDINKNNDCHRCHRPIKNGEIAVKAERAGDNVSWHPQCFTCCKCNQLLADLVYFYHKDEIYCARDLAEAFKVPRCAACDELIFSRPYTVAEGRMYHATHFCCFRCDIPLGDKRYVPDDKTGLPICLDCYDNFFAEKCLTCKEIIGPSEQGVSLAKHHWHATCFICSNKDCCKSLLQSKFVFRNDMLFCSSLCIKTTLQ